MLGTIFETIPDFNHRDPSCYVDCPLEYKIYDFIKASLDVESLGVAEMCKSPCLQSYLLD